LERVRSSAAEHVPDVALEPDELFDVLARLPARQRAAIVLRFYEQMSDNEIAALLHCRPGTVASLVHRGCARLRGAIVDGEGP
jgi:RNA polymerase sigma factor (sigma-70 family)